MATSSVPVNPAGNNQTSPLSAIGKFGSPAPTSTVPASPVAPAQQNPFTPITSGSVIPGAGSIFSPVGGAQPGQNPADVAGSPAALQKQETDIYGKGIGGDLTNLLNSIGGVDSATLQEYIKSLQPQEATAQANLNAQLGASGVGGNSSVAAIGDANLQAQEFAAIAGESAQLTQGGQNLEASILTSQQPAAAQEVASSGWDVFGQVLQGAAGAAGAGAKLFGL